MDAAHSRFGAALTTVWAPYWQVARRSCKRFSTYRAATVAGVVTNTVFGFLKAYILLAVLRRRPHIGGFDATDAVTYTFVAQGLLSTVGAFTGLELADRIPTGEVITDLYRPLHFPSYWLASDLGRALFQAIFRGIPPFVLGALMFDLRLPDPATAAVFLLSLSLAVVVGFCYRFLVALSGFWLLDNRGSTQLALLVMQFFSGVLVPLTFFPAGLAHVARILPFASVVELPIEIFLGKHRGFLPSMSILAQQAAWALALFAVGEWVVSRAFRKVVIQGG
jgi:ABC-2 type transport system permease protein